MFIRFSLIFCALCFSSVINADTAVSVLESTINLTATRPPAGQPEKIIPSTHVKISVAVQNTGEAKSSPGEIFVRFSLRPPHQNEPNSVLFETEKVGLPALESGEKKVIPFTTNHLLPTVFDFVRYDWAMREYEAIIEIGGKQAITGTRALAFTAFYYQGASESKAVEF